MRAFPLQIHQLRPGRASRIINLDDKVDRVQYVLEVRTSKGHGLHRRPVQGAVGTYQKYPQFAAQRKLFESGRAFWLCRKVDSNSLLSTIC